MKINLISDIHATLDSDDGFKVLYAKKQKHSKSQCQKVVDALVEFAHSERPDSSKTHNLSETEKFFYKLAPKNHQEYLNLVDDISLRFKDFDKLGMADREILVDELNSVYHWHDLLGESSAWMRSFKLKMDLDEVASWVMKTYTTFDPTKLESADYLIIAGDLGLLPTEPKIFEDIKKKTSGKFKDVLYIAGNHSHWWHKIKGISEERPDAIDLSNDYCERVDGDWLFLGCTLWTPIPENAAWRIERNMND